ncbi:MAG: hypothetical protein QG574_4260 [Cyanobacteriota bacterium erpe_2018_sw_21hr_WHONDRS-SW48-000092_B_bin.40]|jgi:hypothetical protein|nr:hypothetical protein [Cyanobacteriota bacterium erpe_2018_sw_21hr_WHONDRS-SW48-000092_B_bin.40]
MGDGRLGGPQLDKADNSEALRRFLLDMDGERKGRSLVADKGDSLASKMGLKDGFLRFDDPFASKEEKSKTAVQVEQITDLVKQRAAAERGLSTEQKDDLRRARRDYTLAKTPEDKAKFVQQIEGLVPGSRDLNTKIRLGLMTMEPEVSDFSRFQNLSRRSISTIQCHARPEPSYFEQQEQSRIRTEFLLRDQVKGAVDSFYKPRAEDQFEARWAQIALESPVVKATEALKQLPPIKISTDNAVDVIKYGLTVSGVEMTAQSKEMLEKIAGGIKSISKEGANQFVIERDTKREILLPEQRDVAAGISIKGIEIDNLRFQIGQGKYPELTNIEGLKVKLEVPAILNKVAQIDNEAKIKRIFMTRNEGTGDFTVNAEVTNPVPSVVRNSLRLFNSEVPVTETIVAPIAVLGPDGKPR